MASIMVCHPRWAPWGSIHFCGRCLPTNCPANTRSAYSGCTARSDGNARPGAGQRYRFGVPVHVILRIHLAAGLRALVKPDSRSVSPIVSVWRPQ
jgi:hypothetical protein